MFVVIKNAAKVIKISARYSAKPNFLFAPSNFNVFYLTGNLYFYALHLKNIMF